MTLISHVKKNDAWMIDSGFSHNMTGDKSEFENLEHCNGGSLIFGNDETWYLKVKEYISLTNKLRCDNSYWIEGLKHKLLSVT